MRRAAVASAVVAFLVTAGAHAATAPDFAGMRVQTYAAPKPAPPFSLPDLDGKTHSLGDYRGQILMLFFWATW
jgi:cytochrome oxidase Cu insertion factor (SCO1/SenC/PrrC family)